MHIFLSNAGNDVTSRDGYHNDSGFMDELSPTEASDGKKAVSFTIDHRSLPGENKAATLPRRKSRPKDGFVNRAKTWWQQQNLLQETER